MPALMLWHMHIRDTPFIYEFKKIRAGQACKAHLSIQYSVGTSIVKFKTS